MPTARGQRSIPPLIHMPTERTIMGLEAETAVCRRLKADGFQILDRNWRRPWGELDIVASRGSVIHFVEVKASRRNIQGFGPALRADWRKMTKVRRTAQTWLAANRYSPDTEWQMDVASVIMGPGNPDIELFQQI